MGDAKQEEVRLRPEVLEARRLAPSTAQSHAKRARMVLLGSRGLQYALNRQGKWGVRPRIASNWRRRFADQGLDVLKDRPRAGKKPVCGHVTNKRI
jgi:hypothetical protein